MVKFFSQSIHIEVTFSEYIFIIDINKSYRDRRKEPFVMKKMYTLTELKQLLAVCVSTFYNLNGFMPDQDELCREIGYEHGPTIQTLLESNYMSRMVPEI